MANNVVNKTVNIYIQSGEAQKAFDALIKKETRLKEELEKATDPKLVNRLNDELKKLEEPIDRARKKLSGELSPSFRDVQTAANSLGNRLKRLSEEDADFSSVISQYKQASKELDEQKTKVGFLQRAMQSFWKEAKTVAVGVLVGNTVETMLETVLGYVTGMVTGSAKIADELADIEKTTGLTKDQVKQVNSELSKIDTRTGSTELRNLASEAGKLGNETVQDVKKFVEEADKISVALKEDLGEEAIIDIAKTSKIFKVEMLNMASAINEIGASSEASESFSVDFLKRLSGTAPVVRLAADELLGYSAALEINGQTTEVSATALNTFFLDFVRGTESFGKAAGFAKGELTNLLNTKGTNEAFLQFLQKLKESQPTAAGFINKLKELGIDGARGSNVLLTLAENITTVRDQQLVANNAIQSNASIMEEFSKKNNNAAADLDKLKKNFASLFTSSTITNAAEAGVRTLNSFVNVLKGIPEFVKQNKFALLTLVAGILTLNGAYIAAALATAKSTAATVLDTAVKRARATMNAILVAAELSLGYAIDFVKGRITLAAAAQGVWNTVLSLGAGPIGAILVVVGALVIGISSLISRMSTLTAQQRLQAEIAQKVADSTTDTVEKMRQLTEVAKDNNVSLDNRKKALAALIDIAPEYLRGLTLENLETAEGKKIIDAYIGSLTKKAEIEAKASLLSDKLKQRNEAKIDLDKVEKTLPTSAAGIVGSALLDIVGVGVYAKFDKAQAKVKDLDSDIKTLQADVDAAAKENIKNVLSTGEGTGNLANGLNYLEKQTDKTGKAAEKLKKQYDDLADELNRIANSFIPDTLSRDIANLDDKYNKLRERAKGNNQLMLEVERLYQVERQRIIDDYTQKMIEAAKKQSESVKDTWKEAIGRDGKPIPVPIHLEPKVNLANLKRLSEVVVSDQMKELNKELGNFQNRDTLAAAELNVLKSKGRERLQAELDLLAEQHRQEISTKQLTIFEKEKLDEEYNRKRAELVKNHVLGEVQSWVENVSAALNIVGIMDQAKTERENNELERDRRLNDRKKANLDKQLKAGLVSQQEYDRKVQQLEKAQEKRERETKIKQFKRAQRMQIIQALINGAMAVTSTLAAIPGPLDIATLGAARVIQIGLAVATTAAQVATISKQKPPEYGRGGMLYGPSHADRSRGMPVTHPYTGQVQAFLEGGEGIASKRTMNDRNRYNISGTPSQIISWLNGANGGVHWETGAVLRPAWNSQRPAAMNFGAVNSSISQVRMFAAGGKFGEGSSTANDSAAPGESQDMMRVVLQVVAQTNYTLQNVNATLSSLQKYGVQSNIVLSDLEAQQNRLKAIQDDATMK